MDFYRLFRPWFWIMNSQFSKEWDAFVLDAISRRDIYKVSSFVAMVGGKEVWIGSFPIGYGSPYYDDDLLSAKTISKLHKTLSLI